MRRKNSLCLLGSLDSSHRKGDHFSGRLPYSQSGAPLRYQLLAGLTATLQWSNAAYGVDSSRRYTLSRPTEVNACRPRPKIGGGSFAHLDVVTLGGEPHGPFYNPFLAAFGASRGALQRVRLGCLKGSLKASMSIDCEHYAEMREKKARFASKEEVRQLSFHPHDRTGPPARPGCFRLMPILIAHHGIKRRLSYERIGQLSRLMNAALGATPRLQCECGVLCMKLRSRKISLRLVCYVGAV